ncbi:MAG: 4Fe-4S dicluster domain-containing protein [Planctomycetota bacterium]
MKKLEFDTSRCKGCGLCVLFCPTKSLQMSSDLNEQGQPYPVCEEAKCTTCGLCFRMCPDGAIEVNKEEKKATCKQTVEKSDS